MIVPSLQYPYHEYIDWPLSYFSNQQQHPMVIFTMNPSISYPLLFFILFYYYCCCYDYLFIYWERGESKYKRFKGTSQKSDIFLLKHCTVKKNSLVSYECRLCQAIQFGELFLSSNITYMITYNYRSLCSFICKSHGLCIRLHNTLLVLVQLVQIQVTITYTPVAYPNSYYLIERSDSCSDGLRKSSVKEKATMSRSGKYLTNYLIARSNKLQRQVRKIQCEGKG